MAFILFIILAPLTLAYYGWHMAGYFNGRWDRAAEKQHGKAIR